MKKCIVLMLLSLLFMVSCSVKNKPTDIPLPDEISQNDKKEDTDTIINVNQVNSDSVAYDGEQIFYINDKKLYCIKDDGSKKSLVFDEEKIISIQIHDNKIYMLSFDYEKEIPSKICTVNKDGSGFNVLQLGLEFSSNYYVSHFVVYSDFLLYTVDDFTNTNEIIFPRDTYKLDLSTNDLTCVYEDSIGRGNPRVYKNIYYHHVYADQEYDILNKYNMDTNEKNTIKINKSSHKEKTITSLFHMQDDYIFYSGKFYIDKDNIDGLPNTITLFEDNSFMITNMIITDEYIFFINKEDIRSENADNDKSKINIYRMKLDGSDMKVIYNETMFCTNIAPQSISIVTNNILIYRNSLTNTILALDFNGNKLNWDL